MYIQLAGSVGSNVEINYGCVLGHQVYMRTCTHILEVLSCERYSEGWYTVAVTDLKDLLYTSVCLLPYPMREGSFLPSNSNTYMYLHGDIESTVTDVTTGTYMLRFQQLEDGPT